MRFPVPARFEMKHVAIFTAALFLVQQAEGTEIVFSLLVAGYMVLFAAAYNVAGGLFFPSGAYIFFNGIGTAIIGLSYKALLGEPAQTLLHSPNRTMIAYCGGMSGMGLAAFAARRLRPRNALLAGMAVGEQMKNASIGCLIVAIFIRSLAWSNLSETTSIASALRQIDYFGVAAILLATVYEIRHSNGRRSTNWVVWVAGSYLTFFGLVSFSKEGMFAPAVTWLIPCIVLGFNFSKKQVLIGVLVVSFTLHYLVPYSQYVRNVGTGTLRGNIPVALQYLGHLDTTRQLYLASTTEVDVSGLPHYFKSNQGIFDRIQMLSVDDALVHRTEEGYVYGLLPTYESFANVIPRFLWPNKPRFHNGNDYGREIGMLGTDDETTGISFSPTGDAYHQAEWFGVFVILPITMFLLFFITDTLAGDMRRSPWGLLTAALSANVAPEGLLGGAVYLATIGSFGVVIIALLARYVLPFISATVRGGEQTQVGRTPNFLPLAGRPRPADAPGPSSIGP